MTNEVIFVTHCDTNYLSRALNLILSIRRNECFSKILLVCHDEQTFAKASNRAIANVELIKLYEVEKKYKELNIAKSNRSGLEYIFCLSPFVIKFVFENYICDKVVYLDSDLFFFSNPKRLIDELGTNKDLMIIAHNFSDKLKHLEQYGKFNVGAVVFRNNLEAKKILGWWGLKCIQSTSIEKEKNIFGDQKYLEDFSSLSDNVQEEFSNVLNVAPWNCESITVKDKKILHNNEEIVFYHFSYLRNFKCVSRLGFAGYRKSMNSLTKKLIYIPYLESLFHIEKKYKLGRFLDSRKLSLREWIEEFRYNDLTFTIFKKMFISIKFIFNRQSDFYIWNKNNY